MLPCLALDKIESESEAKIWGWFSLNATYDNVWLPISFGPNVNTIEVFGDVEITVLFSNHIQVESNGQPTDTLYVCSDESIENEVGPVIVPVILSKINSLNY